MNRRRKARLLSLSLSVPREGRCTRNRVGVMHSESIGISEVGRCICTCNNMMPASARVPVGIPGFREAGVCAQPSLTERRPWRLKTSFCPYFFGLWRTRAGRVLHRPPPLFRSIVARSSPIAKYRHPSFVTVWSRSAPLPIVEQPLFSRQPSAPRDAEGRNDFGNGVRTEPFGSHSEEMRRKAFHSWLNSMFGVGLCAGVRFLERSRSVRFVILVDQILKLRFNFPIFRTILTQFAL